MEESVVSRFENGPLRNLFNDNSILKHSGGSGNNWYKIILNIFANYIFP